MMSLSSQKKAESDLLIISYLDNSFMAYTCTNTRPVHCKLLCQCVVCYLLGELVSDQLHLAKSSSPNDFNQIKVIGLHPPLPDLRGHIRICRGMLVAGVRAFLARPVHTVLTSVDKGIDVLYFPDGGMVTVRDQSLHGVQQTVHIDDGPGQMTS